MEDKVYKEVTFPNHHRTLIQKQRKLLPNLQSYLSISVRVFVYFSKAFTENNWGMWLLSQCNVVFRSRRAFLWRSKRRRPSVPALVVSFFRKMALVAPWHDNVKGGMWSFICITLTMDASFSLSLPPTLSPSVPLPPSFPTFSPLLGHYLYRVGLIKEGKSGQILL